MAFVGLLLVKKVRLDADNATLLRCSLPPQLLVHDPTKIVKVSDVSLSILPEAGPSINCFQALDYL